MTGKLPESTTFSENELELVRRVAARDGITVEEAATNLGKAALARRVKKRTGKPQARLYTLPKKRPPP